MGRQETCRKVFVFVVVGRYLIPLSCNESVGLRSLRFPESEPRTEPRSPGRACDVLVELFGAKRVRVTRAGTRRVAGRSRSVPAPQLFELGWPYAHLFSPAYLSFVKFL